MIQIKFILISLDRKLDVVMGILLI